VLTCIVTNLLLLPGFLCKRGSLKYLSRPQIPGFLLVCVFIAGDLVFTNLALDLLSIALQQTIRSVGPVATLAVERLLGRHGTHEQHWSLYCVLSLLCVGPVLTGMGSQLDWHSSPRGILAMLAAVCSSSFKYVLAHRIISSQKQELGTLSFLFWVECAVGAMLAPWALLSGEAAALLTGSSDRHLQQHEGAGRSLREWLLLVCTAAFGGVRIYSQFYLLGFTGATSLALSILAVQAVTIVLSVVCFGTEVTPTLGFGLVFTIGCSCLYTWLKVIKLPAIRAEASGTTLEPPSRASGLAVLERGLQIQMGSSSTMRSNKSASPAEPDGDAEDAPLSPNRTDTEPQERFREELD
jgi:drug/metabolite transporter (DMT)-like permease